MRKAKAAAAAPKPSEDVAPKETPKGQQVSNVVAHHLPPHIWNGYDLRELGIPFVAYPQDRPNLAKHGYTIISPHTGAVLRLYMIFLLGSKKRNHDLAKTFAPVLNYTAEP